MVDSIMSYSRPPVQAGRGLKRMPEIPAEFEAGVFDFSLEAEIATDTTPGIIQVGSGLSITPEGVLSSTGGGSSLINVYLTSSDYTTTLNDYYIGGTKKDITITFHTGITGKVYVVKNQSTGNITVQGSGIEKIDTSTSKTLGGGASMIVVFDGTRWNLV